MDKKYLSLIAALILLGSFGIYASGLSGNSQSSIDSSQGAQIDGWVTVVHTSAKTDEKVVLADEEHNTLTTLGMSSIRDFLIGGKGEGFDYIAMGNGTLPAVGDTTLNSEINDCGFDRVQGTFGDLDVAGNVSVAYTFTSTCNGIVLNTSALLNHTTENTGLLAGAYFTDATLQVDDTLALTWTLNVTG